MTIYSPRKPEARSKEAHPIISLVYGVVYLPSAMYVRILLDKLPGMGCIDRNLLK
jgi:hypothetical protein